MSEQQENTERRIREALLAEASEAPPAQDLWARMEPRLERPAARALGWLRGWRLAVGGAAAAMVLTIGGAGAALIAADQFSGGEDGALRADRQQWIGTADESLQSITVNDTDTDLYDPEGKQFAGADSPGEFLAYDSEMSGEPTQSAVPSPALDRPKSAITTGQSDSWNPQVSDSDRQVISHASIDLEVSDVNAASTQLRGLVQSLGGFVEHISTSGGPNPEYGSAVVRVPSERFLDAIDGIERLGKALGQSLGQRDVTGEAIDLEARLKSERSTEESLLKLLDRAVSVSDVLTVERELSRVRAEIERLQGQLDFLQRSVALATITVSFTLPPGAVPFAPSASLQLEVDDVERSANRVQELVHAAGGTMDRAIVTTRQDSQEAFLSFLVPASALDVTLTSVARDGVVLHRELESGGRLGEGEHDDLQARVTVQLHTYPEPELWDSTWVQVAGGLLVFLAVAGALALVLRARRRRA